MGERVAIPAHVPSERVVDLDIYALPLVDDDAQLSWNAVRGKHSLIFSPHNGGHWIATRGKDVLSFFRNPQIFSSAKMVIPDVEGRLLPNQSDGEAHSAYRGNIVDFFSLEAVDELTPRIRSLTVSLIEAFRGRGECEFISEFALQLPLDIFLIRMELPTGDRLFLRGQVDIFANSPSVEMRQAAYGELVAYIEAWVDKRSAEPGDDPISRVVQARIDGRPYTREEILSTLTLLLLGGLDTVAATLGFIARHLAHNPQDCTYIAANKDKLATISMELIRRYSVAGSARVLARDHEHDGVLLRQGDMMLLMPTLFNLDPERLACPEAVDLSRVTPNITFAAGPHVCAGIHLAKREITVFLDEWIDRIPRFEEDPARPARISPGYQSSVKELWLRW